MAFTSAKMGLRIWNLLTDLYDHAQLADNWAKVDYHDHSPGKGVQIPTEGLADASVTGPKLASALDPSGAYVSAKPIIRVGGTTLTSNPAGTYPLSPVYALESLGLITVPVPAITALYLDPTHWTTSGRTVRYLLRGTVVTNAVAPTATYSYALFPVATRGGASGSNPTIATLGAAVAGSTTATIVAPTATTAATPVTVEFDAPAVGWYIIGMIQTGAAVANSQTAQIATLYAKQV